MVFDPAGGPTWVTTVAPGRTRWRVVYHYGAAHDEARGLVPDADLTAVIASGER